MSTDIKDGFDFDESDRSYTFYWSFDGIEIDLKYYPWEGVNCDIRELRLVVFITDKPTLYIINPGLEAFACLSEIKKNRHDLELAWNICHHRFGFSKEDNKLP